jgi:hypothetical protein
MAEGDSVGKKIWGNIGKNGLEEWWMICGDWF